MPHMSSDLPKTLKKRTIEFLGSKRDVDRPSLLDFLKEVIEPQETITITAHQDENGRIDCVCRGDLCYVNYVPTEEALGCKRLKWLFLEEDKDCQREREEDYVEV